MKFTAAPEYSVHAVSAVCRRNNQFLLIRRAKPSYQNWLAFPGGKIEPGETPIEALKRELKEETNLVAHQFKHLVTLDLVDTPQRRPSYFLAVYEAFGVEGNETPGDDAAEIYWLTLPQMHHKRTIPSVLAIAQTLIEGEV